MKFFDGGSTHLENVYRTFVENEFNFEYLDLAFSYITKTQSIALDKKLFSNEIAAIRLELWGVSLWQYLNGIAKPTGFNESNLNEFLKIISHDILYERTFLLNNNLKQVWESMKYYNSIFPNANAHDESMLLSVPFMAISFFKRSDIPSIKNHDIVGEGWYVILKRSVSDTECLNRLKNRAYVPIKTRWNDPPTFKQTSSFQLLVSMLCEKLYIVEKIQMQTVFRLLQLVESAYNNSYRFISEALK